MIEPDWKRAFYSMVIRLITAQYYLALGRTEQAKAVINKAVEAADKIDSLPYERHDV